MYVRKADGSVYEGWCWPGSSSWVDFMQPDYREWWAKQMSPDKYQVSIILLYTMYIIMILHIGLFIKPIHLE